MHGLDITRDDLLYAIDITEPRKHAYDWRRFEDLDVSIWEGGLQQPNTAFKGIDCIVATEVYGTPFHPFTLFLITSLESSIYPRKS